MQTARLILAIFKIHSLDSKEIEFVLLFPQAELEEDILMQLPIVFQVDSKIKSDSYKQYFLKLNKNLYWIKQGKFNWWEELKKLLVDI